MSSISLKTLAALRMLVGASCLLVPRQAGVLFGIPLAPGGEGVLLGRMTGVRDLMLGAYLWKRVRERGEAAKKCDEAGAGARTPLLFNKFSSGSATTTTTAATTNTTVDAAKRDGDGHSNIAPANTTAPADDSLSCSSVLTTGLEHGHGTGDGGPHGPTTTLAGLRLAQSESALRSAVWLGFVVDAIDMASVIVCSLEGNSLSDLAKVTVGGGAAVFVLIAGQYLVAHRRKLR